MPRGHPPTAYRWHADLPRLLSEADLALGRMDGLARNLLDPDLFVAMYVLREALLSSQIEGTQSSPDDLLAFEMEAPGVATPVDVAETVDHVKAMNQGLHLSSELPLSGRLIRAIHGELLTGVQGRERQPGEFRKTQNWVGPAGYTIETTTFVPPSPGDLSETFDESENSLHECAPPPLVHAGLSHAQFETIHPFLDGNGRVGRLLIALLLVGHGGRTARNVGIRSGGFASAQSLDSVELFARQRWVGASQPVRARVPWIPAAGRRRRSIPSPSRHDSSAGPSAAGSFQPSPASAKQPGSSSLGRVRVGRASRAGVSSAQRRGSVWTTRDPRVTPGALQARM
ncbi:MAG TPA: hypothetical protein ENI86_03595 [Acidimicrobiales bacterium]|nr:hypothetical protein [Acidimicrobiales bacterium]